MVNATAQKFGYPASLVRDYDHWLVLVRPAQVTLGALVVAAKSDVTAYSALPAAAFAEQGEAIKKAADDKDLKAFNDSIGTFVKACGTCHMEFKGKKADDRGGKKVAHRKRSKSRG